MAKFITHLPPTEAGAKLVLTAEQEEKCKVVYKKSEKRPGLYAYAGLWNPDAEYSDEYAIIPFKSIFNGGWEDFKEGTEFANVEGSSADICYDDSWRAILEGFFGYVPPCCAITNTIYDPLNSTDPARINKISRFRCTNGGTDARYIVGAHVLMETQTSDTVPEGSDVYLVPLCQAHNIYNFLGRRYTQGAGYYMKLRAETTALILEGYLQEERLFPPVQTTV